MKNLKLCVLPDQLVVWQLPPDAPLPSLEGSGVWSVTGTSEELSVVSVAQSVPPDVPFEKGWRCIRVEGPLSFELTGVLAALSVPLAQAGISIFVVSTFNTDYLLVKDHQLDLARTVLQQAGHEFAE